MLTNMKMPVVTVTVEVDIGAGKTTYLQEYEESISSVDKFKIRVKHEPISQLQSFFYGNKLLCPLEHIYQESMANAIIFQNYILDV